MPRCKTWFLLWLSSWWGGGCRVHTHFFSAVSPPFGCTRRYLASSVVLGLWCCPRAFSGHSLLTAGSSLWSTGSGPSGSSSCSAGTQEFTGCRAWAQEMQREGLVAPRYVGSSWARDQTRVLYVGRWIVIHQGSLTHIFLTLWQVLKWVYIETVKQVRSSLLENSSG